MISSCVAAALTMCRSVTSPEVESFASSGNIPLLVVSPSSKHYKNCKDI